MAKRGRKPSMKARAKYNQLIVKSYHRLHNVLKKHNPRALIRGGFGQ